MPTILAIDPGFTTGVCMLKACAGQPRVYSLLDASQIPWDRRKFDIYALFTGTYQDRLPIPDMVVVENFRLRPGRAMEQVGSDFPSVQIIGIVEAFQFAVKLNAPIVYQEPSIIARVEILPEHAERLVGKPHAQDAYKHARYRLIKDGF